MRLWCWAAINIHVPFCCFVDWGMTLSCISGQTNALSFTGLAFCEGPFQEIMFKRVPYNKHGGLALSVCFLWRKFWVIIRRQPPEKTQRYKNNFYDDGHIEDGDFGATQIKIERQPSSHSGILRPPANRGLTKSPIKRFGTHLVRDYFNYDVLLHRHYINSISWVARYKLN